MHDFFLQTTCSKKNEDEEYIVLCELIKYVYHRSDDKKIKNLIFVIMKKVDEIPFLFDLKRSFDDIEYCELIRDGIEYDKYFSFMSLLSFYGECIPTIAVSKRCELSDISNEMMYFIFKVLMHRKLSNLRHNHQKCVERNVLHELVKALLLNFSSVECESLSKHSYSDIIKQTFTPLLNHNCQDCYIKNNVIWIYRELQQTHFFDQADCDNFFLIKEDTKSYAISISKPVVHSIIINVIFLCFSKPYKEIVLNTLLDCIKW